MTSEALNLIGSQDGPAIAAAPTAPHISARRDQTVGAFMDDLRKYVLHRSLESTLAGPEANPFGESPISSLSTNIRELYGWNGLSSEGRQFMDTLQGTEAVERALAPYQSHVREYSAWLAQWQAAVHRVALEELSELQRGFRHPDAGAVESPAAGEVHATVPESWLPSTGRLRAI